MDQSKNLPQQRYKLELFVSAKGLTNLDTFSKSDPVCKVFYQLQGTEETYLGATELVKNNLDPVWEKTFQIDYIFELQQFLRFEVWDHDDSTGSSSDCIGTTKTTVGDIIGMKNAEIDVNLQGKKGKETGKLHVKIDKQSEPDQFVLWQWTGVDLINTDGYFGKSDPFLKFFKKLGDGWYQVHKTEVIKNNLNPEWQIFEISTIRLSGGDFEAPFKVECWDLHDKGRANQYMGTFTTTLQEIFNDFKEEFNLDLGKGKSGGKIRIKEKKKVFRPTFYDYLKSGEQINLVVGIDFTLGNGEFTFPDSLHAQRQDGGMNAYQTAIHHCSQILLNYDFDKKVPIYGFGAIPHLPNYNSADTEHCFPLTGNFKAPEVTGLDGVMNTYKTALPHLQFSGPCLLAEIVKYAKQIAERNEAKNIYTVLLLLTCGDLHDVQEVTDVLAQCNKIPLSLIIVGIGESDFVRLQHIDAEHKGKSQGQFRNIVQFVPYNNFGTNMAVLQREILGGLPHQLVEYKTLVGKWPKDMSFS